MVLLLGRKEVNKSSKQQSVGNANPFQSSTRTMNGLQGEPQRTFCGWMDYDNVCFRFSCIWKQSERSIYPLLSRVIRWDSHQPRLLKYHPRQTTKDWSASVRITISWQSNQQMISIILRPRPSNAFWYLLKICIQNSACIDNSANYKCNRAFHNHWSRSNKMVDILQCQSIPATDLACLCNGFAGFAMDLYLMPGAAPVQ